MYEITYLDYRFGTRARYMQTAFETPELAQSELTKIKKRRTELKKNGVPPTRGYFKIKPIRVWPAKQH